MLVDIVVYDGLDELDALGPLEVLRSAAALGAAVTVRLVTPDEQDEVRGAYGLRFAPDGRFVAGEADVLVVPGGGWVARAQVGAWGEYQRGTLLPRLADAARRTTLVAGVCTGTMLLAHAGVVGRRRAATHHAARDDLAATGAEVVDDRVVDDGDLVTSGGVTAGIDLALWLLSRECAPEVAREVAERMEYAWEPPAITTPGRSERVAGTRDGRHG
jgi:transcriptional regulator GlxA family with amidase domain